MPVLNVSEEKFRAPLEDVWRLFVPDRSLQHAQEDGVRNQTEVLVETAAAAHPDSSRVSLSVSERLWGKLEDDTVFRELRSPDRSMHRQKLHQAKRALYRILSEYFERRMPWGALTGIRPTKLYRELEDLYGAPAARDEFRRKYLVQEERTRLAETIVDQQRPYLAGTGPDDLAVYIGVPFCPSRCRYCSFISQDEAASAAARTGYLPALLQELRCAPELAAGYEVQSVYIGGGTPTVLKVSELESLLSAVRALFPNCPEVTVEAGRPDTLTRDIVLLLRDYGVQRVCINPQTTSDVTLKRIGRAHNAHEFHRAMELAQGRFSCLNADMIIGLPGENMDDVVKTVQDILQWGPENVTVHTLAVKNASSLAIERYSALPEDSYAVEAADTLRTMLMDTGRMPYYLYRQKYMGGGAENVGYALPGTASSYNMANMEETASILAFGAGAISKRVFARESRIERCATVKNPEQYIARTEEMIERKRRLFCRA